MTYQPTTTNQPLVVGFEGVEGCDPKISPSWRSRFASLRFASPWKGVTNKTTIPKRSPSKNCQVVFLFLKIPNLGKRWVFNLEMHKRDQERILNLNLRFSSEGLLPCRNVLNLGFLMVPPLVRRSRRSEQKSTLTLTCWKVLLFEEIHPLHTFDAVQQFQKSQTLFGVPSYLILFFFRWHFLSTSRGQSMVNRWLSGLLV